MWSRAVPVDIAKSCSGNDSVSHIDGNDYLFSGFGGYRTFAEYWCTKCMDGIVRIIYIVVDTFAGIKNFPFHSFYKLIQNNVFATFQCMEVKFICKAVCFCADCKSGGDRFSYYGIKLLAFDFFALNPGSGFSLYFIKNR